MFDQESTLFLLNYSRIQRTVHLYATPFLRETVLGYTIGDRISNFRIRHETCILILARWTMRQSRPMETHNCQRVSRQPAFSILSRNKFPYPDHSLLAVRQLCLCCLILLSCLSSPHTSDAQQVPSESLVPREEIALWVAELGSSKFEIRDRATGKLSGLTTDHLDTLKELLSSATDPEIRVRLGSVVAKLKTERQQQIIGVFLRDPDMQDDHGLKGWGNFAQVAGANRSSKRLFLQLYDRYPDLIEQPINDTKQAAELARKIVTKIQEGEMRRGEGDKSDGLALLYAVCVSEGNKETALNSTALRLLLRAPYNQALRDPQSKRSIDAMMERWTLTLEDGYEQTVAIQIMIEAELNATRPLARKMLLSESTPREPEELLRAFQVFFRRGTPEDLPLLEAWLDKTDVCEESMSLSGGFPLGGAPPANRNPGNRPPENRGPGQAPNENEGRLVSTVEIRDVALLACMQIRGMDYRQHFPTILVSNLWGYIPRSIALPPASEAIREARLQAYKDAAKKAQVDEK